MYSYMRSGNTLLCCFVALLFCVITSMNKCKYSSAILESSLLSGYVNAET